jgi:hypothetical protein
VGGGGCYKVGKTVQSSGSICLGSVLRDGVGLKVAVIEVLTNLSLYMSHMLSLANSFENLKHKVQSMNLKLLINLMHSVMKLIFMKFIN